MKITITVRALKAAIKALGNKSEQLGVAEWKYADSKDLERAIEIDIGNLDLAAIGTLREGSFGQPRYPGLQHVLRPGEQTDLESVGATRGDQDLPGQA